MDIKNLKNIIEVGESIELEFKQSFHSVQNIVKIIASFANTQGGILIVGIKDNGFIEGIKENVDILQQKISQSNSYLLKLACHHHKLHIHMFFSSYPSPYKQL